MNALKLLALVTLIPSTTFAITADELVQSVIAEGEIESLDDGQVIILPVDCEGSPCPKEIYGSLNGSASGFGAKVGYVPLKSLRVEVGYQGSQDNYAYGVLLGSRYVIPGGVFEVGGRYLPYDTNKASEEIKDKFRQYGYEVRVNFVNANFSKTMNGSGAAKGLKVFAVISSERKNFAPQIGVGALFHFRKIKN